MPDSTGEDDNVTIDSVGEDDKVSVDSSGEDDKVTADSVGEGDNATVDSVGEADNVTVDSVGEDDNVTVDSVGESDNASLDSVVEGDNVTVDSVEEDDNVTVSLEVVWQGPSEKIDARMSEISMHGCFIDSRVQGRMLGDIVDFKVHLPSGPWVALKGELVREDYPMGFGLRFTELTEGDQRLLAEVVAAHGGDPGVMQPSSPVVEVDTSAPVSEDRRPRILVADDDALTLRLVSAIVESEGYEAVSVSDGRQALRHLQQDSTYSAAIFDMMMPHLQGLDLILFMKADARLQRIPVGMITAERDPKIWDDSVAAGACVFLPKPFTPPQVQMMLRMLASKAG